VIRKLVRPPLSFDNATGTSDTPNGFDAPIFGLISTVVFTLGCILALGSAGLIMITLIDRAPNIAASALIAVIALALGLWLWMWIVLTLTPHRALLPHPIRARFPRRVAAVWALASTSLLIVPVVVTVLTRVAKKNTPVREFDPSRHAYVYSNQLAVNAIYRATDLHAAAVEDRLLLSAALAVTVIAATVAAIDLARRRRHNSADARRFAASPFGQILPASLRPSVALLVIGAILAAGPGAVALSRLASYFDGAKPLFGFGIESTFLPSGQETIFVGCSEDMNCPLLLPSEVDVRGNAAGQLLTFADSSHDRLTEGDQPFAGAVSFTVPFSGTYSVSTSAKPAWRLRLAAGEGQEARTLAAWVGVTGLGLSLMIAGLIAVLRLGRVRHLARRASGHAGRVPGAVARPAV